jgi:hypothetical protein
MKSEYDFFLCELNPQHFFWEKPTPACEVEQDKHASADVSGKDFNNSLIQNSCLTDHPRHLTQPKIVHKTSHLREKSSDHLLKLHGAI